MNFKLYIIICLLFSYCNKPPIDESILSEIFPGRKFSGIFPKKVYEASRNISPNGEVSKIYILRDKNEEYLVITQNQKLTLVVRFVMQNYGAYKYEKIIRTFEPTNLSNSNQPFIVQRIEYITLGSDTFDSLFMEILSEEPPFGLFQVPLVYRDGVKIFDGLNLLSEEKFLREWKYSRFSLMDSKSLMIHSPSGLEKTYLWENGSFIQIAKVSTGE